MIILYGATDTSFKMTTESDPAVTRVTVVLDRAEDWHKWLFIRKDTAQKNELWQYVDPATMAADLPTLMAPPEPQLTNHNDDATSITQLTAAQQKLFQWEYERWERKDIEYKRKKKALAEFNSEISKTIAARHLYLIENKDTPYDRLTTLKKHLSPSDTTRQRDLITRYKALQIPARGKKIEEWLRSWVEVTNMCISANVPETMGSRAQEDFLVACRTIDPEYGTSGLRALIELEEAGKAIPSVEDYVSKFTTYLKRVRPLSTGLNTMAAELEVAEPHQQEQKKKDGKTTKPHCPCGLKHFWPDCWLINTEHPRRPKTYANPIGQKKLDAALAADPDLKVRIEKALDKWRAKHRCGGNIAMDDGRPPTIPIVNTLRYMVHDPEQHALDDDDEMIQDIQVKTMTTKNDLVDRATVKDDGRKPENKYFTAASLEKGVDRLSNRWILDPGSNTHVINTEEWVGWTRDYEAAATDTVGAGTGSIPITAWGTMELMAKTPTGLRGLTLTHVAYVPGFVTSLIGLARCRKMNIHFDSGRDILYKGNTGSVLAYLEHDGGHWLVDADVSRRPNPILLSSFGTTFRPSKAPRRDQKISAMTAHQIWGHPGRKAVGKLTSNVDGLLIEGDVDEFCSVCTESKLTKQISRRQQEDYAKKPFYRISMDIIQFVPQGEVCLNGDRWAGHQIDQYSKWHEVSTFPQRSKPFLSRWIIQGVRKIQRVFNCDVIAIKTDNERGYGTAPNFLEELCKNLGIRYEARAEYTEEQNGLGEIAGALLVIRSRAMGIQGGLPKTLSNELIRTAAYVLNRTPTEALGWKTPYEVVWGTKPKVQHMRPIGCRAYVLNRSLKRADKLESRALIGHLVGYDSTNIFRIWLPTKDEVIRTRDVVFDPTRFYEGPQGYAHESIIEEVIELLSFPEEFESDDMEIEDLLTSRQRRQRKTAEAPVLPESQVGGEIQQEQEQYDKGLLTPELSTSDPFERQGISSPSNSDSEQQNLDNQLTHEQSYGYQNLSATQMENYVPDRHQNNAPRRRNLDLSTENIIDGPRRTRREANYQEPGRWHTHAITFGGSVDDYLRAFATALKPEPMTKIHRTQVPEAPRSFRELDHHQYGEQFRDAAQKEYRQIWEKGCFAKTTQTAESADAEVLPLMWVFDYKFDEDGYLYRFKARLVIRGDLQQPYGDTYAATLAARTFRAIVAIANQFGLELLQYDVPNAFLHATLNRKLYAETPDGFKKDGELLQVLRALYGLKESPLLWYKDLRDTLQSLGLTAIPGFPCVYVNTWLIMFVFVDDMVMAFHPTNKHLHQEFENTLNMRYNLKSLGQLKWFLGIRVVRDTDARTVYLVQDAYIDKVAAKYNIVSIGRQSEVPMLANYLEQSMEEPNKARKKTYQELVGHLAFLTQNTRPDLARAHVIHASHLTNPGQAHIDSVRRVWRHIVETKYQALQAQAVDEGEIQEYLSTPQDYRDPIFFGASDAAFADDVETRRSSQGYVFQLFGMTVDWKSTLQRTVTKSTTEAELLALSLAGSEMEEWCRFFKGLSLKLNQTPIIWCDNEQTVGIVTKEQDKLSTKLKHVDIHQNWVRQEVQQNRLHVKWRSTNQMPADGMTKILPRQKHNEFIKQLHLVDIRLKVQNIEKDDA